MANCNRGNGEGYRGKLSEEQATPTGVCDTPHYSLIRPTMGILRPPQLLLTVFLVLILPFQLLHTLHVLRAILVLELPL